MTAMFKHKNGRLKTTRVALAVFALFLAAMALAYRLGPTADKAVVKVTHLFEAPAVPREKAPVKITRPVPPKANTPKKEETEQQSVAPAVEKQQKEPAKKQKKIMPAPEKTPAPAPAPASGTVKPDPEPRRTAALKIVPQNKTRKIELPAGEYFKAYRDWQNLGTGLDKAGPLPGVSIHNLKTVYPLFQMKPVALLSGSPHTDLSDNSRIAKAALSDYSSTCFVVESPWQKWGRELKKAGFAQTDPVEVRYYTYDVVRNAIYARALDAFRQGLGQTGLPKETQPGKAEIVGAVYTITKQGGGSFGIFSPKQVNFTSGQSVTLPQAPNIETLKKEN